MTDHGTIAQTGEISPLNRSQGETAFAAQLECIPTRANRQPAIAFYNLGEAMALDVFRIEEGMITEVMTFPPSVFERFGLPSRIR